MTDADPPGRMALSLTGRVQGVGFRPFVYRLARRLALEGWVRNTGTGVDMEVQGPKTALATFRDALVVEAPPQSRIDTLVCHRRAPVETDRGFVVVASRSQGAGLAVGPDTSLCAACLGDLFDPANRRWRHPFITCTDCGPRYTVLETPPWDRARTSMAGFQMCPACKAEDSDPDNRRFQSQTNACPACGPRLIFVSGDGTTPDADPIHLAHDRLVQGAVLAVKGVGGYHLVCNARSTDAVARLRQIKARPSRPFAVMVANGASAQALADLTADDIRFLEDPRRPVLLCPKGREAEMRLAPVAPGIGDIGLMLPSTGLHYLLFHEHVSRPGGVGWLEGPVDLALVCTSANRKDEPLMFDDARARKDLDGSVDGWLTHDRAIVHRCDDSVLRSRGGGAPVLVRRARGYVPDPLPLQKKSPPILALGGLLKNTQCQMNGGFASLSSHLGDLVTPSTLREAEASARILAARMEAPPVALACDLHPDFPSTLLAHRLGREWGVPVIPVQHHHAHIAAVACEHGLDLPLLGLALDGLGLGTDGTLWGGELLLLKGATFSRLGWVDPVPLPGGDRAAQDPWRVAAGLLHGLGRDGESVTRFGLEPRAADLLATLSNRRLTPLTSSMGRVFDGASALLGLCTHNAYEAQGAMLLETAASRYGPAAPWTDGWTVMADGRLDLWPLFGRLADGGDPLEGAARFHGTLCAALTDWVCRAASQSGVSQVALGGGCFVNRLLLDGLTTALTGLGLSVWTAHAVPPNDAGLSLGQAHVAHLHLQETL